MPGHSYSGEITRAIRQSRAFVLIFSEHSNNSEQVLREVQLAANSRLHIVQFPIDHADAATSEDRADGSAQLSVAPPPESSVVSTEEAELFVKQFNRGMNTAISKP
jgi:TIR domain